MPNQEAGLENLEPAVRLEEILDGQDIEPATRIEAILAGEDVAPATRIEYFLKKAMSGGGDESPFELVNATFKTSGGPYTGTAAFYTNASTSTSGQTSITQSTVNRQIIKEKTKPASLMIVHRTTPQALNYQLEGGISYNTVNNNIYYFNVTGDFTLTLSVGSK